MAKSGHSLILKKRMVSSLLDAADSLANSAVPLSKMMDMIDPMTRALADAVRNRMDPTAESLRRDVYQLRDQGRLLNKTHAATKKRLKKLGAAIFDIDINPVEIGEEVRRVQVALKEIINANVRFGEAANALFARVGAPVRKSRARSAIGGKRTNSAQ
jgi:hypothetical protein